MVRINLINPEVLTDEHLYAENVENDMEQAFIFKYPFGDIPNKYCLGKGHMSFFRNKIEFIIFRKNLLANEIAKRKNLPYNINYDFNTDWVPSENDINLNIERIVDRLRHPLKKKNPWHYYGKPIDDIEAFIKKYYGDY